MGYAFDADYVRRLSEGDVLVEKHFFSYFDKLLYAKLSRKIRNREAVKEARQETFARVLGSLRKGRGIRDPRRLGSFVYGVCENVLREYIRDRKRHPHSPVPGPEKVDPRDRADSDLVRREIVQQVRQVLEELPELDRTILRELFLEELDRDELCRRHGVTREYLRVLIHRSKGRFRERYEDSIVRRARTNRGRLGNNGPRPQPAD